MYFCINNPLNNIIISRAKCDIFTYKWLILVDKLDLSVCVMKKPVSVPEVIKEHPMKLTKANIKF